MSDDDGQAGGVSDDDGQAGGVSDDDGEAGGVSDDDRRWRSGSAAQAAEWDARYREQENRMWSGRPNGRLVAEASALPPGRALDIGCGEGADAIWLADRGWTVTAIDISEVAISRARQAASEAGVTVEWLAGDVMATEVDGIGGEGGIGGVGGDVGVGGEGGVGRVGGAAGAAGELAARSFDLVSLQYPALPKAAGEPAVRQLLDLVRPGGRLLAVYHDLDDEHREHMKSRGTDPADYVGVEDLHRLLGEEFTVELFMTEPRLDPPPGTPHMADVILRARRQ